MRGLGVQANASPSKLAALAGQASRRCDSNRAITYGESVQRRCTLLPHPARVSTSAQAAAGQGADPGSMAELLSLRAEIAALRCATWRTRTFRGSWV